MPDAPVRLCCMTRHFGQECPDGTFMCQHCFAKVPVADAWRDESGQAWDVCAPCKDAEAKQAPRSSEVPDER